MVLFIDFVFLYYLVFCFRSVVSVCLVILVVDLCISVLDFWFELLVLFLLC